MKAPIRPETWPRGQTTEWVDFDAGHCRGDPWDSDPALTRLVSRCCPGASRELNNDEHGPVALRGSTCGISAGQAGRGTLFARECVALTVACRESERVGRAGRVHLELGESDRIGALSFGYGREEAFWQ